MTNANSGTQRAMQTIGPGQTEILYEVEKSLIPVTPDPVSVYNLSEQCDVIVVAESSGLPLLGEWKETYRMRIGPNETANVSSPGALETAYRVKATNTCERNSADVSYTIG